MPFYAFNQNNSGGGFSYDEREGISHWVIIEASSANEANSTAASAGIYFDGCDDGRDCSCCGDRWYPVDDSDAESDPTVWGQVVSPGALMPGKDDPNSSYKFLDGYEGFIHYADGRIEGFWKDVAPRQDLDGAWGYGVTIGSTGQINVFLTTSNGYDPSGNMTGLEDYHREFKPPAKAVTWTRGEHGYAGGWFPTYAEARAYAEKALVDMQELQAGLEDVSKRLKVRSVKAMAKLRGNPIIHDHVTDYTWDEQANEYVVRENPVIEENPV